MLTILFIVFIYVSIDAQTILAQIQLQKALYQEHVIGDIVGALQTYEGIIESTEEFPKDFEAQIQLQMAICYEKLGQYDQAHTCYMNLVSNYPTLTEITHIASIRLLEYQRRQQMRDFKEHSLQSQNSTSKEELEDRIRKLQDRIRELEQKPSQDFSIDTMLPPNPSHISPTDKVIDATKPVVTDATKPVVMDATKPVVTDATKPVVTDATKPVVTDATKPGDVMKSIQDAEESGKSKDGVPTIKEIGIAEALSTHLYHLGNNLYQQGLLLGARENLIKSLDFNSQNEKARDLLKKVEAMIIHRETLSLHAMGDYEVDEKKTPTPESTFSIVGIPPVTRQVGDFVEKSYDCYELFYAWKLSMDICPENIWANNLIELCRNAMPANYWTSQGKMTYKDKKIVVFLPESGHETFTQFWKNLSLQTEIVVANGALFYEPQQFQQSNLVFFPTASGIFYAFCDPNERTRWRTSFLQDWYADVCYNFPKSYVFLERKVVWKALKNLVLVQGVEEQNLLLQNHQEGVQVILQKSQHVNKLKLQITAKKIRQPLRLIHTHKGIMQIPLYFSQQEDIEIDIDKPQTIIFAGIVNSDSSIPSDMLVYMEIESKNIRTILSDITFLPSNLNTETGQIVRRYDVSFLQKIKDPECGTAPIVWENRQQFILRWFKQQLGEFSGTLHMFQEFLMVTAPPHIQQKIARLLQELQQKKYTLCQLSIQTLSCSSKTFDKLLQNCKLTKSKDKGLQVYAVSIQEYSPIKLLEDFADMEVEKSLPTVYLGNTQLGILCDHQVRSFTSGLDCTSQNFFWQGHLSNVLDGIVIACRPIMLENYMELELHTNLYFSPAERTQVYEIHDTLRLPAKYWEQNIQRGQIAFPCRKNYFYIIAGFSSAPQQSTFMLVVPEGKEK